MILEVSGAMFAVILVGWLARRHGYLDATATAGLSRLLVDVTFPALVFIQLLRTVDAEVLRARWYVPVLGAGILVSSGLVGAALAPVFAPAPRRRTFVFLVAIANWIFLPLPIAQALHGAEGVQTVLLVNVGAQVVLWTVGPWLLRGAEDGRGLLDLVRNPGMVATATGLAVALSWPAARLAASGMADRPTFFSYAAASLLRGVDLVATLTVPLSLVVTGAQLASATRGAADDRRPLVGLIVARLLAAPLTFALVLVIASRLGARIAHVPATVCFAIAAMPSAVSCGPFAERFGGDVRLATRGVFATTVVGLLTVPIAMSLAERWLLR